MCVPAPARASSPYAMQGFFIGLFLLAIGVESFSTVLLKGSFRDLCTRNNVVKEVCTVVSSFGCYF